MSNRQRTPTDIPGVFKRGNTYEVRYRDGGRIRNRAFRTKTEARRFKAKVDSGQHRPGSREPFRDHARRWARDYSGRTNRGVADNTRESYEASLERYAIPYFGATKLDDITAPRLKDYVKYLSKQTVTRKGKRTRLTASSVKRHFGIVRALLADAVADGLLSVNPAREVRVIVADHRPAITRRLTSEQTKQLLAEIPAEHADLVYLLASTGTRISEALSPAWRDLGRDEHGPTLTIRRSKTRAGERTIALTPDAAQRLTRRRSTVDDASPDAPIFPSVFGTPIDPRNWRRRVFKPAAVRAGVPQATPHWLRHGVASLMAEHGYSAADIARHLGHADGGALALKTYVHPTARRVDFLDSELGS